MEINELKTDQCVIVGITGRLDTTNYSMLEKKLMDLIDNQHDKILVECSGMDYISSSGLRILLMGLKKVTALKGKFVLCGLQENIHEIFEISGFTSIFEIHPSREEALKIF
ncbi:MAG: STAS domain-containing protein [Bacteroidetes bacterium]|nr:STAS domain-containing protein [Bacteroidota bacterium]